MTFSNAHNNGTRNANHISCTNKQMTYNLIENKYFPKTFKVSRKIQNKCILEFISYKQVNIFKLQKYNNSHISK